MKHQEAEFQKACVKWYRLQYPKEANLLYMNHQNGRSLNEQSRLKAMGLVAGVPDLTLLAQNSVHFFELKVGNNKQTEKQVQFQSMVDVLGHGYYLIYELDMFMQIVDSIKKTYK
jgi:hypothetical protein